VVFSMNVQYTVRRRPSCSRPRKIALTVKLVALWLADTSSE